MITDHERRKLEAELRVFAARNFVRPAECKNLEQVRFYVRELCLKIEELETKFNFVPASAYTLLAQYNMRQNAIIDVDFRNTYSIA
jgi:hypothetical protein